LEISSLRKAAFSESIWEDHIERLETYPSDEFLASQKPTILRSISQLRNLRLYPELSDLSISVNDGALFLEYEFLSHSNALEGTPALFHLYLLICESRHLENIQDFGTRVTLSPWLLGDPISLPRHTGNGWLEFGQEIEFGIPGFVTELEKHIVQSSFYYLHSTIGLAFLKIGFDGLAESIDDFLPVVNDVWQKYHSILEKYVLEELE
jgi:hypothetical protein